MREFTGWLGLLLMGGIAAAVTAGEWLPWAVGLLAGIGNASAALTDLTGFNWTAAGGALFFGIVLLLYMNQRAPVETTDDGSVTGIDYTVPRFIDVGIIE